jgi:signal peptidase I
MKQIWRIEMKTGNKKIVIKRLINKMQGLTCCVLAGLFVSAMINIFVCQSVRVSGKSMEPSYHDGDRIVMEKISYRMGVPKRFDVVVFPRRENYYLVKRVIGLPGETVQISAEGDIFIDGRLLKEDYGMEPIGDAGIAENGIILGENEYFVLGDNRNHSADSRNTGIGNVSIDEITGKIVW